MFPDHPQRNYRGLNVLIMGLGAFGGGLGSVRFFVERGAHLVVTDMRPADKLSETLAGIREIPDIEYKLGGHDPADFDRADLVVVNPAVRPDHPCLQRARAAGTPLTSEMNLFWQWNPAPIIGVTGSNGKSTTTALTETILRQSGRRTWLGGNIGISLLPRVADINPRDICVLELSSFQLADLNRLQVSPAVAVITNFAPNHLDWHDTLDDYRDCKQTILRWQSQADVAVLNADDPDVRTWQTRATRLQFGLTDRGDMGVFDAGSLVCVRSPDAELRLPIRQSMRLPGRHNLANALAAVCAAMQMGADAKAIEQGLKNYQPLPHRLQWVADVDGRSFYNDSLATTPESTIVALEAFESPIILLAGGYDKRVDLSQMAAAIARKAKACAVMGQTAARLRDLIATDSNSTCEVSGELHSFSDAIGWAVGQSSPGDIILLSPGCASYDWFRNFADRGHQFMEAVQSLQPVASGTA